MVIRHSWIQSVNNFTLESFCNMLKKDIIIIVGGIYFSVLEHCRKRKFRTFLYLTLIGRNFMMSQFSDFVLCVVQIIIFGIVGSISKV